MKEVRKGGFCVECGRGEILAGDRMWVRKDCWDCFNCAHSMEKVTPVGMQYICPCCNASHKWCDERIVDSWKRAEGTVLIKDILIEWTDGN